MGIKGQKINPVGWRVGIYRKWKSNWFTESWNYGLMLNKTLKVQRIVESFLLYKRFAALTCNILVLNNGNNRLLIMVLFYNLRSLNNTKKNNKIRYGNRFKTPYNLYNLEKKQLITKNKNIVLWKNYKNSYNYLDIFFKKIESNKNSLSKNKPFKTLYLQLFKRSLEYKKKISLYELNIGQKKFNKNLEFYMIEKFHFLAKKMKFSQMLEFLLSKKMHNQFQINFIYLVNFFNLILLANKKKHVLSIIILFLKQFSFFRFSLENTLMSFILEKFSFFYLFKFIYKANRLEFFNYFNTFNFKTILSFNSNSNKIDLVKYDKKFIDSIWNRPFYSAFKKLNKNNTLSNKRLDKINKAINAKLNAPLRKILRLKGSNITHNRWKYYLLPIVRNFRRYRSKFNLSRFNYFLQYLNKYLFFILKNKRLIFTTPKNENFKKSYKNFSLMDDLKYKSSLVNSRWFFSIEDLKLSLESILGKPLDIYFINSVSLLRYQSKLVPLRLNSSYKKLGLNLLMQQIRFNKININRQENSLLKQPFFLEKRNKRFGPFIHDFVLLVLTSLITRNFKVLLKFINFQTQTLSSSKRQIPFIRLLIRLLANLGGSIVKIKGLRIQFKGRFDRWNRTKSIIYTSGSIPFQKKSLDIEYTSSHGIVPKGTYGIRLWIWYGSEYHFKYKALFESYWYNNVR